MIKPFWKGNIQFLTLNLRIHHYARSSKMTKLLSPHLKQFYAAVKSRMYVRARMFLSAKTCFRMNSYFSLNEITPTILHHWFICFCHQWNDLYLNFISMALYIFSVVVIIIVGYLVDLTCWNGLMSIISTRTVKAAAYCMGS